MDELCEYQNARRNDLKKLRKIFINYQPFIYSVQVMRLTAQYAS